jgi:hypothetical protein
MRWRGKTREHSRKEARKAREGHALLEGYS